MARAVAGTEKATPPVETIEVGDAESQALTVDRETVKRLWRDGRDASWAAARAQDEAATLSQRLQACSSLLFTPHFVLP